MLYKVFAKLFFIFLFTIIATCSYATTSLTDNDVAALLIQQSIANYSGRCPCPYSQMKNGRDCGGRSAYSKPGGESPLCYRGDVTVGMIKLWRDGSRVK